METVMGFPKSLPPVMRKPQGAGPAKVTITGMAAGGSGRAGNGGVRKRRGAEGTRQRRALAFLHQAQAGRPPAGGLPPQSPLHPSGSQSRTPRVPSTGLMETGSAFLPGRGSASSRRRRVSAATAASSCCPGAPGQGWWLSPLPSPPLTLGLRGSVPSTPLAGCGGAAGGTGQARSSRQPRGLERGRKSVPPWQRSRRLAAPRHGKAKPAGFGGEDAAARAASGRRGKDPAAHRDGVRNTREGCKHHHPPSSSSRGKPAPVKDAEDPPGG